MFSPRLRNSFGFDFFIIINRLNVRFDPVSFELDNASLVELTADGTVDETVPSVVEEWIRNGECGRRQPFDQREFLTEYFEGKFSIFIEVNFVSLDWIIVMERKKKKKKKKKRKRLIEHKNPFNHELLSKLIVENEIWLIVMKLISHTIHDNQQ